MEDIHVSLDCDIGQSLDMDNMYIIIYTGDYIRKLDNTLYIHQIITFILIQMIKPCNCI